jgi:hypothetical protein
VFVCSTDTYKFYSFCVSEGTEFLLETFFLISWGGVGLCPLGTSATNWPVVPAPFDR